MEAFAAPWRLAVRMAKDPGYGACWLKDVQYYKACDFFNGRKPPRTTALKKFKIVPEQRSIFKGKQKHYSANF
jgi:hypothetical protein